MTLWDQKETLSPDILLQNCLCQLYLNCAFFDTHLLFFFFPSWKIEGNEFGEEGYVMMKQEGGRICHGKNYRQSM